MKKIVFLIFMAFSLPLTAFSDEIIIKDPRSVCVIVNRDSNDVSFLDIKSKKIIGRVFLGNWVNPHMAAMTPDGRRVLTGGTRANKAYIIDVATMKLIKEIPVDIAPEHLGISPDSRFYYQGNPDGDSVSIIDLVSLKLIKHLRGFAEPLNITFLPDGSKAYVANYGAHWVGVIDVKRHELLKKIRVGSMPRVTQLDPTRYLSEIKGISNASITRDGRYLYAADGDLGLVAVIDTREDKVVKTIMVGADPWRAYPSPDGTKMVVLNNGDETISIIDIQENRVIATLESGPDMVGANFSHNKAFVISSSSSFVYVYDLETLKPAGRIKIGVNLEIQTAATDSAGEKMYLTSATDNALYIIDGKTEVVERVGDVGLYPWGSFLLEGQDNYCH